MRIKLNTVLLLVISFTGMAHAAEQTCADQNDPTCAAKPVETPPEKSATLRESIDSGKAKIAEALFGLDVMAFGDAQSFYNDAGDPDYQWGTFEVDAAIDTSYDIQGAIAVVQDAYTTTMTVGFLDYNTSGARIAPRGRLSVEKGFHVQIGRFDIPFGNDWQFFASKDSVSISRPLSTDQVMGGGYNDEGIRVFANNGSFNYNSYLLHGLHGGRLVGGRVGITPFSDPFSLKSTKEPKNFEFGLSYLHDGGADWSKNETAWAVDAEVRFEPWVARLEYLDRTIDLSVADGVDRLRGWHLTQEYSLEEVAASPTVLFLRYGEGITNPAEIISAGSDQGDERDARVDVGFSANLGNSNVFQWKFEVQQYLNATPSSRQTPGFGHKPSWFTQLVVIL